MIEINYSEFYDVDNIYIKNINREIESSYIYSNIPDYIRIVEGTNYLVSEDEESSGFKWVGENVFDIDIVESENYIKIGKFFEISYKDGFKYKYNSLVISYIICEDDYYHTRITKEFSQVHEYYR